MWLCVLFDGQLGQLALGKHNTFSCDKFIGFAAGQLIKSALQHHWIIFPINRRQESKSMATFECNHHFFFMEKKTTTTSERCLKFSTRQTILLNVKRPLLLWRKFKPLNCRRAIGYTHQRYLQFKQLSIGYFLQIATNKLLNFECNCNSKMENGEKVVKSSARLEIWLTTAVSHDWRNSETFGIFAKSNAIATRTQNNHYHEQRF